MSRIVLTARARCSVAVLLVQRWGFLYQRFSSPVRNEADLFRTAKQNLGRWHHSSIRDSWPIAFSGYPIEPRVAVRLGAPSTQRLTNQLTRSPTRMSRELHSHRPEDPSDERTRSETLQLFVVSDVRRRAHSSLPHHQNYGGNLPRQSQPRHFRPHALGHQFRVHSAKVPGLVAATIAAPLKIFFRSDCNICLARESLRLLLRSSCPFTTS